MYYRRKIILAILNQFDGQLEKIRLQKLLFLFTRKQENPEYDFIPYKFGCYSYSAVADLNTMVNKGMLQESGNTYKVLDKTDYLKTLKEADKKNVLELNSLYGNMTSMNLMKHTYVNFPFYAINSVKAKDILTKSEIERVEKIKPNSKNTVLFTIGYEGISLEEYLNRLIKNNVKVLIDVRNNPLSMKFGFSKTLLKRYCESLGIEYLHFPEVGIQSTQRQELHSQSDYNKLFADYRKSNLPKTRSTQLDILELLKSHKRIALTCFEANICQCHRKHLAEAIEKMPDFKYEVKHI